MQQYQVQHIIIHHLIIHAYMYNTITSTATRVHRIETISEYIYVHAVV